MDPLDRYIKSGLKSVDGWLAKYSAAFIVAISEAQRRASCAGAVGEIGVHHGKLFILLLLTASSDEKVFAIDIFEKQHLNYDHSGCGDRTIFLENVRRWAGSPARVEIIPKSSLEVDAQEILSLCGKVRLLSIDGGHTEQCTLNDLLLADATLHEQGVAIIDDYFNLEWPDVSSGVSKYLSGPRSRLKPFAISPNKVYFCDPRCAEFYRSEMRRAFTLDKENRMFGCPVDIYGMRSLDLTLVGYMKERLRNSRLGPPLLAIKGSLKGG